jgi:hypothetical protein
MIAGVNLVHLAARPAEFGTILSEAIEKWTREIKFAGIKVE